MDKIFDKKYSIELPKLVLGEQEEVFQIDNSFFEHFENSPIREGSIQIKAKITKFNTHLDITFDLKGTIVLECDRCLEDYPHQLKSSERIIYTYDEKSEKETGDVILIDKNEPLLLLGSDFHELIFLEIPIRKVPLPSVHKCAPGVLALINNVDADGNRIEEEETDPRWNELKKLKDK